MKPLNPAQQPLGFMRTFPVTSHILVGLAHGGVDVDGGEDLIQTQFVLHRGDKLSDQLACVVGDDGGTEDCIFTRLHY